MAVFEPLSVAPTLYTLSGPSPTGLKTVSLVPIATRGEHASPGGNMPKLWSARSIGAIAVVYLAVSAAIAINAVHDYGQRGLMILWLPGLVGVLLVLLAIQHHRRRRYREFRARIARGQVNCVVRGSTDPSLRAGMPVTACFGAGDQVAIAAGGKWVWFSPRSDILSVEIEGPGYVVSGGGFVGGGTGIDGALAGIAAATALNSATTRSSVLSRLLITARSGALTLETWEATPEQLRSALASLLAELRHRATAPRTPAPSLPVTDRVEALERLARLRADGVLSDAEFAVEKRRLLG